jgi:hypothetical protein
LKTEHIYLDCKLVFRHLSIKSSIFPVKEIHWTIISK